MSLGDRLQAELGVERFALARWNKTDPRDAMALALQAYLLRPKFVVAGEHGEDREFQLNSVETEWPESFQDLDYPAAAITSGAETAQSGPPIPLEETWGRFCADTVLWKTGELQVEFQVDFWCANTPDRQAVAARLPDLFNPTEERSGVLLEGPESYFGQPIRFTWLGGSRVDNAGSVEVRDREYRARILGDITVVQLRRAVEFLPRAVLE